MEYMVCVRKGIEITRQNWMRSQVSIIAAFHCAQGTFTHPAAPIMKMTRFGEMVQWLKELAFLWWFA